MRFKILSFKVLTIIALLAGIFSLFMLSQYYILEKDFRQEYKSASTLFHDLQKDYEQLSYGVLQSTLFAYYNQDRIAKERNHFKHTAKQLLQHPLFKKDHYQPFEKNIKLLQDEVLAYIEKIEYFLMLNGGIKNSSVFLSNYEAKIHNFFTNPEDTQTIHKIINGFLQTKRLLDLEYIKQLSPLLKKIEHGNYNKQQATYINPLLIHSKYLYNKYPLYIELFSSIMNSPLRIHLKQTQKQFEALAQDDFTFLNTLAISLFSLITLATLTISLLLYYSQKSNKKLLILHDKLNFTLQHDSLTHLLNRHSYDSFISQQDSPIVLLINISKFKLINDFYGSDNADQFLIKFARRLNNYFSNKPVNCYRISGDEFVVTFTENSHTKEEIELIAHKLNTTLTKERYKIADINHTISINMAISNQRPLLETADMALKLLKLKPTINILHYSQEHNIKETIRNNIEITQILHDAINNDRIIPYFQPIINLKTRKIVKYEALVRLQLEDGSVLSPASFLPIAQKTPLYYEITRIMIAKTISYFADKSYRFSINFSMSDFEDEEIINTLMGHYASYPKVFPRMDIEILESEMLSNMERVKYVIGELKKLGCGISIDDFGSGYANFFNLIELDLDVLKIDGSLIKGIKNSSAHYKTVKAIMGLVNEMGIDSIAEYVQDEASAQLLEKMGVTHAQGYYFGKPDARIKELN